MLRGSDRAGASVADLRDAMPLRDWLRVAVPPSLAGNAFDPHLGQHFIPIVYVGVVTCALAIVGAIFAWRRIGGWLALLIASIVFAHLPLPLVRYPARLVPFGALAIVAIAVEGWDVIATRSFSPRAGRRWRAAPDEGRHPAEFRPPPRPRPPPSPPAGGGGRRRGAAPHARPHPAEFAPHPAFGHPLPAWRGEGPSQYIAIFVSIAIAFELTHFAKPLLVTAPMQWTNPVPYDVGVGRALKIVRAGDPRLVVENRRAWIAGYLNLYQRRFDAWTAAPLVSRSYAELYARAVRDRSMTLLSSMSVGYVLAPRGADVVVYRNASARPLVSPPPSLLAFGANFIHAAVALPNASTVVVTQQRASGWSVDVDGKSASLDESGDFLAVNVPAGKHDVVFHYRSVPLVAGALLTLLALLRLLLPKTFVKR